MNDMDVLQRFLFEDAPVRGELVHLNESYQAIIQQHPYPLSIRHLLGEALAVVCLLSAIIKVKGRLTLQFRGKGKLKLLVAQCDRQSNLRGVVQYEGDLSQNELLEAQQQGVLAVIIDPDIPNAKQYQGIVAWQGISLTQAVEGYFMHSEQLSTRLWLAVNEKSVAGLMLQMLPKEKPELFRNDWEHLLLLTQTLTPEELLQLDNATLLHRLYSQEKVRLFAQMPIIFCCVCSVQRSENAILVLGQKEAEEELKSKQKIIVTCEFCNKEYGFDQIDVMAIFKNGGQMSCSKQVH